MPNWLDHPQASYVLAAYAVAALLLLGLWLASLRDGLKRRRLEQTRLKP